MAARNGFLSSFHKAPLAIRRKLKCSKEQEKLKIVNPADKTPNNLYVGQKYFSYFVTRIEFSLGEMATLEGIV